MSSHQRYSDIEWKSLRVRIDLYKQMKEQLLIQMKLYHDFFYLASYYFNLPKGVTTSLEAPLTAALAQLSHINNVAACNQLNAFLNQVNAKQTYGQLTSQQAADLSQQAKAIQQSIGCSNVGGMLGQTSPSLLPLPMP